VAHAGRSGGCLGGTRGTDEDGFSLPPTAPGGRAAHCEGVSQALLHESARSARAQR